MRLPLMICATLFLTGCVGDKAIVMTPLAACADLIPADWTTPVDAPPVPMNRDVKPGTVLSPEVVAAIAAPWAQAYVETSGALEKANARTRDAITIFRQCEKMVNAARPDAKR